MLTNFHAAIDFWMEQKVESELDPTTTVNGSDTKAEGKEGELVIDMSDSSSIGDRRGSGTPMMMRWSPESVSEAHISSSSADLGYGVAPSPLEESVASIKEKAIESMIIVKDVLGRWGKRVEEASKKAEDLAGNTWQHLKTAPSFADAAMGRIAQGTKLLAEGGYEKIFHQTFDIVPEEKLIDSFACYLSTSAGPVMGVVYISTSKLAFCSDSPLSYKSGDQTEWNYYKVVVPLHQLKAVNPSYSRANGAEKYIQIISVDNHEFWYMGFLNYDAAVKCFQDALENHNLQQV